MATEKWIPIKGFETSYAVSSYGRVRSLDRFQKHGPGIMFREGKVLKGKKQRDGYLIVGLSKDSKKKWIQVHRLVAEHFIDNPKQLPIVNHIDENKHNNKVNNLEWVTAKENTAHFLKLHPDFKEKRAKARWKDKECS